MTPYQERLLELAIESESAAISLWWRIDEIGDDVFSAHLAAVVAMHNAQAASLAATAFAAQATVAVGSAIPVAVTDLRDRDINRLAKAATTVIEVARESPVPENIIGRLARAEPLKIASDTYQEQVASSELVEGWTRGMDADPCQLCQWWSREGRVWPKAHPFQRHTGCACVPIPVWRKEIQSTMYTRQRRTA
ncbi:hypothetical protein MCHIJ_43210 [Mycolicibacterium chitae]|uniref:Uncharacterized protein n=1 Tax=Mycolicibacterium chitae TaxID=1792 RepID=A0A448I7Q6_MYCCI|nr:hypothetical protein [Mycolicibacterium chitae]BBZ04884.1 hypothetical protein MCHIJ_43210 [Mycolicibacterium chitae]VEG48508.1 Uncharacterised protein [Mycolicibacterium chitae]